MARRRYGVWALSLALACAAVVSAAQQEKPLDNAEIIALTKLDMGDTVIIAKIKAARQVAFDTSTDALVKLKEAGVSKPVITAMIERQGAPAAGGPEQKVTLRSKDGSVDLKPISGIAKSQASPFSIVTWVQFEGLAAKVRTRDRRPSLVVASDGDPRGRWWYVKTSLQEDEEDYRYFDLEGGGAFSMVWSGAPERGSVVKCDAVEEGAGLWVLTPVKELKPGEYGLFSGQIQSGWFPGMTQGQSVLFDFGIDK